MCVWNDSVSLLVPTSLSLCLFVLPVFVRYKWQLAGIYSLKLMQNKPNEWFVLRIRSNHSMYNIHIYVQFTNFMQLHSQFVFICMIRFIFSCVFNLFRTAPSSVPISHWGIESSFLLSILCIWIFGFLFHFAAPEFSMLNVRWMIQCCAYNGHP